jgi:regulator of RNase E activity RraA
MDKPSVIGSFWGDMSSNSHRAFGCVGTITDGAVRDVDKITNAVFKPAASKFGGKSICTCQIETTVKYNYSKDALKYGPQ